MRDQVSPEFAIVEIWGATVVVCYPRPMPSLNIRNVGDGPMRGAMWHDGVPCIAQGFHEWPKVGERHVIDGVLCRLVEISDRWIWERELS